MFSTATSLIRESFSAKMKLQAGFAPIVLIILMAGFFVVGIGGYFIIIGRQQDTKQLTTSQTQTSSPTAAALSPEIKTVLDKKITLITTLAADPALVKLVEDSLNKNSNLTAVQIKALDDQWKNAEADDSFIKPFLNNEVALILIKFQEDHHEFPEIFVTDKVGLNVGQTNKTSDYYQADEDWWVTSFAAGVGAANYGEIEYDESAKSESIALYVPIFNPQRQAIGVIKAVLSLSGIKREL